VGREIERKFLVRDESWRQGAQGVHCRQGYLAVGPPVAVRVRIADGRAILNMKKKIADIARDEFEYAIPVEEAEEILARLCDGHVIEKMRYRIVFDGMTWEVDEFGDVNQGLVVAEIELDDEDQAFEKPPWVGEEVSYDARYLNLSLSRHPYTEW